MAKKTADSLSVPPRRTTKTRRTTAAEKEPRLLREPTFEEIAEAAYHRYLRRGGDHGADFEDWIEAERELKEKRES